LNALTGHRIPAQGNALGIPGNTPLLRPERAPHIPVDLHMGNMRHPYRVRGVLGMNRFPGLHPGLVCAALSGRGRFWSCAQFVPSSPFTGLLPQASAVAAIKTRVPPPPHECGLGKLPEGRTRNNFRVPRSRGFSRRLQPSRPTKPGFRRKCSQKAFAVR
jgi:hypothetical protein